MKICEIIREEYISSRVPAASGYLTDDEIRVLRENPKILQEVIPLIIMGAGAAWTAYEAWQMKQAYDRGEISGADVAKAVGTDIAIMIIGGAVTKVGVKAWRYGKKIFDSRRAAQNAAMVDAAATVKARTAKVASAQNKDLVVQPKPLEGDILPPVTVPKPPARATAVGPKPKSGEQEIAPPGGVFYSDAEKGFDKLMGPGRGPRTKPTKEQLKQMKKRDDADIAADIDAGGPALRAAEKARKIAKYKETENVEDLRGLSFSDAFQLGGIDLAKKFPLPKPTIPAHLRTAAGREHAALSDRESMAKIMKAIKNDKP